MKVWRSCDIVTYCFELWNVVTFCKFLMLIFYNLTQIDLLITTYGSWILDHSSRKSNKMNWAITNKQFERNKFVIYSKLIFWLSRQRTLRHPKAVASWLNAGMSISGSLWTSNVKTTPKCIKQNLYQLLLNQCCEKKCWYE